MRSLVSHEYLPRKEKSATLDCNYSTIVPGVGRYVHGPMRTGERRHVYHRLRCCAMVSAMNFSQKGLREGSVAVPQGAAGDGRTRARRPASALRLRCFLSRHWGTYTLTPSIFCFCANWLVPSGRLRFAAVEVALLCLFAFGVFHFCSARNDCRTTQGGKITHSLGWIFPSLLSKAREGAQRHNE